MTQPTTPFGLAPGKKLGQKIPVQRFRGKLLSHVPGSKPQFNNPAKTTTFMTFNFGELTIIETAETWVLPTIEIAINWSEWEGSPWDIFAGSMRALIPMEAYATLQDPLSILDGKMQEWAQIPYEGRALNEATQKWEPATQLAWNLVWLDGFGQSSGPGLLDLIVDFADGKQFDAVKNAVYNTSEWRGMVGYSDAVTAMANNTLLSSLVGNGKLTVDALGGYHKA